MHNLNAYENTINVLRYSHMQIFRVKLTSTDLSKSNFLKSKTNISIAYGIEIISKANTNCKSFTKNGNEEVEKIEGKINNLPF